MKDTTELARAAGVHPLAMSEEYLPGLERFAARVRADEREACAKACESFEQDPYEDRLYRSDFADAIRARGSKE